MYDRDSYLDTTKEAVSYDEFIHKELIHFSKVRLRQKHPEPDGRAENQSAEDPVCGVQEEPDTLKSRWRSFRGTCLSTPDTTTARPHLNAAIVGMGQNFVGSNNINLLVPSGQFGTRLQGGKDSASERYIFTYLSNITRKLFPAVDDPILKYLNDDGLMVEPIFYAPIIPMILVNGAKGIGTGFSTDIMPYNPTDIIEYLRAKLNGTQPNTEFVPYYEGFEGTVVKAGGVQVSSSRVRYEPVGGDKVRVTELPMWDTGRTISSRTLEGLLDTSDSNGKKDCS